MTIKDLAKKCGVSVSTVSRVLNNRPDVSAEVREKVLDEAKKNHYVRNDAARDLVKPQQDTIGLIVRGADNIFFTEVMKSIEDAAEENGYILSLRQIASDGDELKAGAKLAKSKKLRGILFLGGRSDYKKEEFEVIDIPSVFCTYSNRFGDLGRGSFSSVGIDDEAESEKATEYLINKGHRKIAIITNGKNDSAVGEARYRGYLNALAKNGINEDPSLVVETGSYDLYDVYSSVRSLISSGSEFSAVFAISDAMAIAAVRCLYDSGIYVPADVSVISIDGIVTSRYVIPSLTTVSQPKRDIGRTAFSLLMDIINGDRENESIFLPGTLIEGESVRKI